VLSADIAAGVTSSLTILGDGSSYPASGGRIIIGDEIIIYGSGVASGEDITLSTLTRGADGTVAESHSADDSVQLCLRYESQNPV